MTQQGLRQAGFRTLAGVSIGDYNSNLIAASEAVTGVTGLTVNGAEILLLQGLLGSSGTNLEGLRAEYAISVGASDWDSVGTLPDYAISLATGRTALPAGWSITRASSGTYIDSTGTRQTAAVNEARFHYAPETLQPRGLLIESASTNHFLNSGAPVTQTSPSLGTGNYALWMEGTGSVAVAGNTATITGAGTATDGSYVPFAVTGAGTVNYTVTGSPTLAQAESSSAPTSYIPTTAASVTRAIDLPVIDNPSWFNPAIGTFIVEWEDNGEIDGEARLFEAEGGTANFLVQVYPGVPALRALVGADGIVPQMTYTRNAVNKYAFSYGTNLLQPALNGALGTADTTVTPGSGYTSISVGTNGSSLALNGTLRSIRYFESILPNDLLTSGTA